MLNHVATNVFDSGVDHLVVVLGCNRRKIHHTIQPMDERSLRVVMNEDWSRGQASSIRCGYRSLVSDGIVANRVLIALADQPNVSAEHFRRLMNSVRDETLVAATNYPQGGGVPACLTRSILHRWIAGDGDIGMKRQIRELPDAQVQILECESGLEDIDTPEDYRRYRPSTSKASSAG